MNVLQLKENFSQAMLQVLESKNIFSIPQITILEEQLLQPSIYYGEALNSEMFNAPVTFVTLEEKETNRKIYVVVFLIDTFMGESFSLKNIVCAIKIDKYLNRIDWDLNSKEDILDCPMPYYLRENSEDKLAWQRLKKLIDGDVLTKELGGKEIRFKLSTATEKIE
ncbi:hypothetical protein BN1013_01673 [Candidatus Rubidus massiliensis]|nr:hypothetical protein BN1013_01673 [Candidatus Rubidus massiliensis]